MLLIETRREVKLKEGDMWVYSIAVYGFFSRSISVILILTCILVIILAPCKVKRENLVSLPLTGAACETVKIVDLRD